MYQRGRSQGRVIPEAEVIAIVQSVLLREGNGCWAASGTSLNYSGTLQTTLSCMVFIFNSV